MGIHHVSSIMGMNLTNRLKITCKYFRQLVMEKS